MIKTRPVEFESVEHRNDVHDAVKGRAEALSEDDDRLRALFDVGQTLAYVEKNEPYEGALRSVPFTFESEATYRRAIEELTGQSDDDLDWLGRQLEAVGLAEEFDPDETPPGGVESVFDS